MISTTLLFEFIQMSGGIGVFLGIAFFFVCLAVAVIAFKMLKKSVKMAFRILIVGLILLVAFVGSIAFLVFGTEGIRSTKDVAPTQTPRKTR